MAITTWTAKWGKSQSDFAELTTNNVDFVSDAIVWEPGFKLDVTCDSKGIKYWFDKLTKYAVTTPLSNPSVKNDLLKVIERIDVNNSTHLESCDDGRKKMCDRICFVCTTIDDLKSAVRASISPVSTCLLFSMLQPLSRKKTGVDVFNISFASKFVFYARKYLCGMKNPDFSIYDKVVRERLAWYVDKYASYKDKYASGLLECGPTLSRYDIDKDDRTQAGAFKAYTKYSEEIGLVIGAAFSREDFDHLVWFTSR